MKRNYSTKNIICISAACSLLAIDCAMAVDAIDLSSFGSSVDAVDWTWDPATSNLSGTEAPGAVLFPNSFSGADLTTLSNYGENPSNLRFNLTGFVTTPTPGAFSITLESTGGSLSVTPILWSSFGTTSSTFTTEINTSTTPGFSWSSIIGWTLDSGGSGNTVNATFTSLTVTAVPEPSSAGSFTARAPGGVRFLTSTNETVGVQLSHGATSWQSLSDRAAKTEPSDVDHRHVLGQVAAMPVSAWQYKHDPGRRYVGPMAQDFHAAFGLGDDDKHISTLDLDGVAFSALKGLIVELQERKDRSAAQEMRLRELESELLDLQQRLAAE